MQDKRSSQYSNNINQEYGNTEMPNLDNIQIGFIDKKKMVSKANDVTNLQGRPMRSNSYS